jgi:hypothetical protein
VTGLPDNAIESYSQMERSGAGEAGRFFSEMAINMGNIVLNWDFPFGFQLTTKRYRAFTKCLIVVSLYSSILEKVGGSRRSPRFIK